MHGRSLLDSPVSAACMKGLLRNRMGRHCLPRDEASWANPQVHSLDRVCLLCALAAERHIIFECPELQDSRAHLFQGPKTMQAFMWQDDLIGIAMFVNMYLNKVNLVANFFDIQCRCREGEQIWHPCTCSKRDNMHSAVTAFARVGCTDIASRTALLKPLQLRHLSRQCHRQLLLHMEAMASLHATVYGSTSDCSIGLVTHACQIRL